MSKALKIQRNPYRFHYAVKFICTANISGTSQTSPSVLPGVYQTAVNIHNPQPIKVKFRKKIASGLGISKYFDAIVGADAVQHVNCSQINDFGIRLIHGFEGFLVIESTHSLDVVAVYTAGATGGQVTTIDVEPISERVFEG
jgi:hypothetical protein